MTTVRTSKGREGVLVERYTRPGGGTVYIVRFNAGSAFETDVPFVKRGRKSRPSVDAYGAKEYLELEGAA